MISPGLREVSDRVAKALDGVPYNDVLLVCAIIFTRVLASYPVKQRKVVRQVFNTCVTKMLRSE